MFFALLKWPNIDISIGINLHPWTFFFVATILSLIYPTLFTNTYPLALSFFVNDFPKIYSALPSHQFQSVTI